jgi:histidyl-tRNA synthetase
VSNRVEPIRSVKGTRDLLPPDTNLWQRVEQEAHRVFAAYHYGEIRTPILEETALFARGVGTETDIVKKEMYTFEDHGVPHLAGLRSEILTHRPLLGSPEDFLVYLDRLQTFIAGVKSALEKGLVLKTPQNFVLLNALESTPSALKAKYTEADEVTFGLELDMVNGILQDVKFGDSLTLRPEATASVVRAYIEHSLYNVGGIQKLYYIGPMFRRERPQKGRYRQFYQIGAEVLGSQAPMVDVEILEMLVLFLERVGIREYQLLVNSVGCSNCRPAYLEALRAALQDVKSTMCVDCQRRADTNPLRVLDCKVPDDQPIIEKLPKIIDHLDPECRQHFDRVKSELGARGLAYHITPRLVRGLDYYTRTTFEITSGALGAQNALVGGGRYDGLSEMLGGPPTPGIGFSIGQDRLILAVQAAALLQPGNTLDVFVVWMGEPTLAPAARLVRELRAQGLSVEIDYDSMKIKKAMGIASKLQARFAVIIGEGELAGGKYQVKNMASSEQIELSPEAIGQFVKEQREIKN